MLQITEVHRQYAVVMQTQGSEVRMFAGLRRVLGLSDKTDDLTMAIEESRLVRGSAHAATDEWHRVKEVELDVSQRGLDPLTAALMGGRRRDKHVDAS